MKRRSRYHSFLMSLLWTGIYSLIAVSGFSQAPFNYERSWKAVDSLMMKRSLPKSALAAVQYIYQHAISEKNEPQIIKSLVYKISLENTFEADINAAHQELENEALHAGSTAAAILYSLDAQMLWDYLQQHRWELYRRSTVIGDSTGDIKVWNVNRLNLEISRLYKLSVSAPGVLQKTDLQQYGAILIPGNSRKLRPTLYDLLANRAIAYYITDEYNLNKPANAFTINDDAALSVHTVFENKKWVSADTASPDYEAILMFQKLLRFHESDPYPDALISWDLKRLEFIYQHAVMPNKKTLYTAMIRQIASQYPSNPAAAQAWFLQAKELDETANRYDPLGDSSNRYARANAKKICEQVLQQADSSDGKTNCLLLLRQILRPVIRIETENVNLPEQPFRALVTYKNVHKIFFRVITIDDATQQSNSNMNANDWKRIINFPVENSFSQEIPDTRDFSGTPGGN